ncbi:hypothetical protein NAT51_19540 [Flavobacterium amniphilum]|uniref:hypothetical protein n=1 Tax=Flavobacterium amniphilum TaxID=1834035 RepID=UPI00202A24E3|nr:hypothetical protein [Flavobacterium amniphilum]MCL9807720.1 hypothetical protein [Flavobacterium amniphilum]
MKKIILGILLLSTLTFGCNKEPKERSFYLKYLLFVLNEENPGHIYKIKQTLGDKVEEIEAIYLGNLNSDFNKYKIIYSVGYYGNTSSSLSATSILTIFDEKNILKGFYNIGPKLEKLPYIKANNLIFPPDTVNDCNMINKIDFSKKIPKDFFIECKNQMGDIYNYQEANKFDR